MGVMQVAQHADDLDRARAFYEMLLGQPPAASFEPPGLLFFTDGAVRLLLERGAPSATMASAAPFTSAASRAALPTPAMP